MKMALKRKRETENGLSLALARGNRAGRSVRLVGCYGLPLLDIVLKEGVARIKWRRSSTQRKDEFLTTPMNCKKNRNVREGKAGSEVSPEAVKGAK